MHGQQFSWDSTGDTDIEGHAAHQLDWHDNGFTTNRALNCPAYRS